MHWLVIIEVVPGSQRQPAVLPGNDLLHEGKKKRYRWIEKMKSEGGGAFYRVWLNSLLVC